MWYLHLPKIQVLHIRLFCFSFWYFDNFVWPALISVCSELLITCQFVFYDVTMRRCALGETDEIFNMIFYSPLDRTVFVLRWWIATKPLLLYSLFLLPYFQNKKQKQQNNLKNKKHTLQKKNPQKNNNKRAMMTEQRRVVNNLIWTNFLVGMSPACWFLDNIRFDSPFHWLCSSSNPYNSVFCFHGV